MSKHLFRFTGSSEEVFPSLNYTLQPGDVIELEAEEAASLSEIPHPRLEAFQGKKNPVLADRERAQALAEPPEDLSGSLESMSEGADSGGSRHKTKSNNIRKEAHPVARNAGALPADEIGEPEGMPPRGDG